MTKGWQHAYFIRNYNFTTVLEVPHALFAFKVAFDQDPIDPPPTKKILRAALFNSPLQIVIGGQLAIARVGGQLAIARVRGQLFHIIKMIIFEIIIYGSLPLKEPFTQAFRKKQLQSRHKFHRQLLTMSHNSSQQKPPPPTTIDQRKLTI